MNNHYENTTDMTKKRILDFTLAVIIAPFAFILCVTIIPFIYVIDGVPPIFKQTRVGLDNKNFVLFKLRTMVTSAQQAASHELNSTQITRTGNILRQLKLDELPQIINVLNGTMSFVGPRPCLPTQTELIRARTKLGVDSLRPGITGPAQVQGLDMSTPEQLAIADSSYLQEWSLAHDLLLMMQTFAGRGRGDAITRKHEL